MKAHI